MLDNLTWQLEDGRLTLRVEDDCEYTDDVGGDFAAVISEDSDGDGWLVVIEQEMRGSPVEEWYETLDEARASGRKAFVAFVERWRETVAEENRRRERGHEGY